MSELMDQFWRLPAMPRNIASAIFVVSLGYHIHILPAHWFYFHYMLLAKIPPQIWRYPASFLISHGGLSIILDPYFVYSYILQLETTNPKFSRREDVVWYLLFVSTMTIVFDNLIGLNSGLYLQGMILALAYTGTQDQRGVKSNFFFVTIPAQLVPYAMMFAAFIMSGPTGPTVVMQMLCGLFAAHLHDFLTRTWPEFGGGRNWLATPQWLSRLVTSTERAQARSFGTAIRPAGPGAQGSGPLPDAWRSRGSGHRLG